MKLFKVRPGSKLSLSGLCNLTFESKPFYFQSVDSEGILVSKELYEDNFEAVSGARWTDEDLLDFAKWVKLAQEEFIVLDKESIKCWEAIRLMQT